MNEEYASQPDILAAGAFAAFGGTLLLRGHPLSALACLGLVGLSLAKTVSPAVERWATSHRGQYGLVLLGLFVIVLIGVIVGQ